MQTTRWQFWIDRGGTFTDVIGRSPAGEIHVLKLLSESPGQYTDAPLEGIRRLIGARHIRDIRPDAIDVIKMGTTVATNALLEGTGEATLLCITRGQRDALRIGYQNRPAIFARKIERSRLLYTDVLEIDERITADGRTLRPLDEMAARRGLQACYERGLRSVAIVLMHAYRFESHERILARIAAEVGFQQISVSHRVAPLIKLIYRGDTTVVDAYLSPVLRGYLNRFRSGVPKTRILLMQSNGGLADAESFAGKDSILSGPAGGVVGVAKVAQQTGREGVIGFDMGGTSTDVCLYDGRFERTYETEIAGVRLRAPMLRIRTIAAGGGSLLTFDGSRLRVGPESAGANPGPVCYRRGGPLALTDANVMLGKIQPDYFPHVFGPTGDQSLDVDSVFDRFARLSDRIGCVEGHRLAPEEVAEGLVKIAVEKMALAIKEISVARGYDVTEFTLCSFGGAGGQHACLVADALGMNRLLIPARAGLLSAWGIGLADLCVVKEKSVQLPLNRQAIQEIEKQVAELMDQARAEMANQFGNEAHGEPAMACRLQIKYEGTDSPLEIDLGTQEQMERQFVDTHRRFYGFVMSDRALVVDAVSVELCDSSASDPRMLKTQTSTFDGQGSQGVDPKPTGPAATDSMPRTPRNEAVVDLFLSGRRERVPLFLYEQWQCGSQISGPALLVHHDTTIVVEPGWNAERDRYGNTVLERVAQRTRQPVASSCDPVMLEVFNNLFMSVAQQMGIVLRNSASSVNIKERLDFSCALFDRQGNLVANAPHIPVHLGAMGAVVKSVLAQFDRDLCPGDVFLSNNPYQGGSHLPDLTVVTPVFDLAGTMSTGAEVSQDGERQLIFFVASRGHHADVGGITPGSMPPHSTHISQEGTLFDNVRLVRNGKVREGDVLDRLQRGPHPARNPAEIMADLKAQIAANQRGVNELRKLIKHYGLSTVTAYMGHVQRNAEQAVRRALRSIRAGSFADQMDDGTMIRVTVDRVADDDRVRFDFSGTADQHPGNLNAPSAIVRSAVLYVLRTLVDDDIPLNDGCLAPVEIAVPNHSVVAPDSPAAVVGGNVETSQRIVDVLYGALSIMAAGQGTMNNLTFGNDLCQYYETIAGGSGAGPDFPGQSGVHVHMTNTRITDPEVIEDRFPVVVEQFEFRPGSGGRGRHAGGDGLVRRIRFLEKMTVSMLSQRRTVGPYGMDGGQEGTPGVNRLLRDGIEQELPGCFSVTVQPGDRIIIETPGGGGYGSPD